MFSGYFHSLFFLIHLTLISLVFLISNWEFKLVYENIITLPYINCTVLKLFMVDGRRKWQSTPVFLPRESYGQRSLGGYSPWGRKESDTTERLHLHLHPFSQLTFILNSDTCYKKVK